MAATDMRGGDDVNVNVGPDFYAVVAAVLAVVLLVDISVLWLTGKQVPELLSQLTFGVFGFYFGRAPVFKNGQGNGGEGASGKGQAGPAGARPVRAVDPPVPSAN